MLRRRILILILSAYGFSNCYGQTYGPNLTTEIPKIIPPSPNAAALEKFGSVPVDYSTGIPSISYPMWSWSKGKLSFNVGLAYHAGGHKVEDMASNVGLGWTLTGTGRISRTVRGTRDDNVVSGFMYTATLPQIVTYSYDGGYQYTSWFLTSQQNYGQSMAITPLNSPYSDLVRQIVNNEIDAEQDIFSFSFNGFSGRFIIDKNQNIIPLENTNFKIQAICNPTNMGTGYAGMITAFKITDDDGIVYKFDYLEQQWSKTITTSQAISAPPDQDAVTGWLLTKIIDPLASDSIVFNYTKTTTGLVRYEAGWSENEVFDLERPNNQNTGVLPSFQVGSGINNYNIIDRDGDINITSIIFPDGTEAGFEYNFSRRDYSNTKALTGVTVKNYQNSIVKRFALNYSYFYSNNDTTAVHVYASPNDYNRRLKLDGINEISNDGTQIKPTSFFYEALRLNTRNSGTDLWGYNVDPARVMLGRIPRVKLNIQEWSILPTYGQFLSGADRRPDSLYVKAALLQKIQYPTGGSTSFEYECNKAYSPIDYYEDRLPTNSLEWYQNSFGQSYNLQFGARTDITVELVFKTEEFQPRPEPVPGEPQTCFGESQDNMMTRFEIRSTDLTFFTYIEGPYNRFKNGGTTVIDLPLGKSYTVKFIYDANATCAFRYPFKALVSGTYIVSQYDKLAGGVRIKKLIAEDGFGNTLIKQYDYNDSMGHSSATLNNIPNYGYYRTTQDAAIPNGNPLLTRHINRNSNPTYTLNYHNGAPLIYTRVREIELDGSSIERQYDAFQYIAGGNENQYPFVPGQDFPNLSGLMTRQIVKDKNAAVKKEEIIAYKKNLVHLTGDATRNLKAGTIATAVSYSAKYYVVDNYHLYTSIAVDTSRVTKVYENAQILTQTQKKSYHFSKYYLTGVETTTSKGEARAIEFSYPFDSGEPGMSSLVQLNILQPVVFQQVYKPNIVNGGLSAKKTNYQLWSPNNIPLPANEQKSLLQNSWETELTYNAYDDKGNLLQYTAKDGIINSFVWGYNKQYPVANIVGKTYSDAISQSGLIPTTINAPASDAAMRTELAKLRNLSGALVTTYTYKPLVGVTSETDPNGKTVYYQYDNFNRLSVVRDKDNNIVKKLCYNYYGQPIDCGYGALAAWQSISSSCETNGQGNTGNMIVVEKDMNPSSTTYNQTRNVVLANSGVCTPCNSSNCSGNNKKCINGVCATGFKIYTAAIYTNGQWNCTYHYLWTQDCSDSQDYQETLSFEPFLLEEECP